MQAHGLACKLIDLQYACKLICVHSGTFWNLLEHSGNVMSVTNFQLDDRQTFWNILEQFVTNVMSVTDFELELQLEHSGTFWNDL